MPKNKGEFLLAEIIKVTIKIKERHPITYKMLGETPLFGKPKDDHIANNQMLKNYLETLKPPCIKWHLFCFGLKVENKSIATM